MNHPAHVAGLVIAQDVGAVGRLIFAKNPLDGRHGDTEALALVLRKAIEHRADRLPGAGIEPGKGGTAGLGQGKEVLAAIALRDLSGDQAALVEAGEDAAEIAAIEAEIAAEIGGAGPSRWASS